MRRVSAQSGIEGQRLHGTMTTILQVEFRLSGRMSTKPRLSEARKIAINRASLFLGTSEKASGVCSLDVWD